MSTDKVPSPPDVLTNPFDVKEPSFTLVREPPVREAVPSVRVSALSVEAVTVPNPEMLGEPLPVMSPVKVKAAMLVGSRVSLTLIVPSPKVIVVSVPPDASKVQVMALPEPQVVVPNSVESKATVGDQPSPAEPVISIAVPSVRLAT